MAFFAGLPTPSPSADHNDFLLFPENQTLYPPNMLNTTAYIHPTSGIENTYSSYETHLSVPAFSNSQGYDPNYCDAGSSPKKHKKYYGHSHNGSPVRSASHEFDNNPPTLSTTSEAGTSFKSTASSAMGSPPWYSVPNNQYEPWNQSRGCVEFPPDIVKTEGYDHQPLFTTAEFDTVAAHDKVPNFIDPHLVNAFPSHPTFPPVCYPDETIQSPLPAPVFDQPISPPPSVSSFQSRHRSGSTPFRGPCSQSPYLHSTAFQPYPQRPPAKRMSSSEPSRLPLAGPARGSFSREDEGKEKGQCPIPGCGKFYKDLKAHMLTHQDERPEKCPIVSCDFHVRGFARKYDRNRHTLTHYRGTMVCGFCPGSGSPSEKTFNRADVFKRHLTKMHGVEQIPPNSRRKLSKTNQDIVSPAHATGKCSTCSVTFDNAQDFYEHLDDCVLRIVQQIDPSEAINEKALRSVANDEAVRNTLDRHSLPHSVDVPMLSPTEGDTDEDVEQNAEYARDAMYRSKSSRAGVTPHIGTSKIMKSAHGASSGKSRAGLNASKQREGFARRGRKARKSYPLSWGYSVDKLNMKKRVLWVYDGPRRLVKDDMMLDTQFEVRIKLPFGDAYVTDLDVETLKRAEAFHNATDEERGPWIPQNMPPVDLEQLMA